MIIKNEIIKNIVTIQQEMVKKALNAEQTVEKSIVPIYHLSKKYKLEQIGSGVLIKIQEEYFVFSASHVFDLIGDCALAMGVENGGEIVQLPGERFSSPKDSMGTHRKDAIDASAYRIVGEIPQSIKNRAITLEDIDMDETKKSFCIFLSAGYRIKKSNSTKYYVSTKNEAFPSIEVSKKDYELLKLNPSVSIALWHQKYWIINGKRQQSPTPRGFSGGAMIKVIAEETEQGVKYKQKLVGIITEHRNKSREMEGVLIGTRIIAHLSAIHKYMPELNLF